MPMGKLNLIDSHHLMTQALNSVFSDPSLKIMEQRNLESIIHGSSNTQRALGIGVPHFTVTQMPRWQVHLGRSPVFAL